MDPKRLFALALVPALAFVAFASATQEPAPRARDASEAPDGPRALEFDGSSVLHVRAACLRTCIGETETEAGSFLLPGGGALGEATVTWSIAHEAARTLRITIAGVSAAGTSPLRLELGTLPAGRHLVDVAPVEGAIGVFDQRVDWHVTFLVHETPNPHVVEGRSGYTALGPCLGVACERTTPPSIGRFFVPWEAKSAVFQATWTSGRTLHWTIGERELVADGPFQVDLGALAPGERAVRIEPTHLPLPLEEESARWQVVLTR